MFSSYHMGSGCNDVIVSVVQETRYHVQGPVGMADLCPSGCYQMGGNKELLFRVSAERRLLAFHKTAINSASPHASPEDEEPGRPADDARSPNTTQVKT